MLLESLRRLNCQFDICCCVHAYQFLSKILSFFDSKNINAVLLVLGICLFICFVNAEGWQMVPGKNVGLRKFWQDLEILKSFLISLEVLFLHGLQVFESQNFYQGVLRSIFN